MKIRRAERGDFDVMIEMGRAFLAQTPWFRMDIDLPSIMETLDELRTNENGLLLVAEHDDRLVGMLGVLAFPHYFNKQHTLAQELFWWVVPEARGTGAGKVLFEAGQDWAKSRGAKAMVMISVASVPGSESVDKMYARAGYEPAEHSYVRFF